MMLEYGMANYVFPNARLEQETHHSPPHCQR